MSNLGIDINIAFSKLREAIGLTEKLNVQLDAINNKETKVNVSTSAFDRFWSSMIAPPSASSRLSAKGYSLSSTPVNSAEIAAWQEEHGGSGKGSLGIPGLSFGKLFGLGTAAMGIGGLMSFVGQSRRDFKQDAILRARLAGRGIGNQGMYLGYNTTEAKQIAEGIAQGTGYQGAGATAATRAAMEFSRATGTDTSFATSLMSGWRDTLNANPEMQRKQLALLTQIASNTKDSVERVSRVINANYGMATGMQGGMELTKEQKVNVPALTETLWSSLGSMGRNSGIMRNMYNMLKPTGDQMTDMEKLIAMGVDKGTGGWDTVIRMKRLQAEGLTTKEGRDIYRTAMGKRTGDDLMAHLQLWMPESMGIANTKEGNEARLKIHNMLINREFEGSLEENQKKIENALGTDKTTAKSIASKFSGSDANRLLTQDAQDYQNRVKEGQLQYKAFQSMSEAATELVKGLVNSRFAANLAEGMSTFSRATLKFEKAVEFFFDKASKDPKKKKGSDKFGEMDIALVAREAGLNVYQSGVFRDAIKSRGGVSRYTMDSARELAHNISSIHSKPGKLDPKTGTMPEVLGIDGLIYSINELVAILKRIPFLSPGIH